MLYLDITDLVHYFAHHRRVSGIQRVVCEVASHILAVNGNEAKLVAYSNYHNSYVFVDHAIVSDNGYKSVRKFAKNLGKYSSLTGLARRKRKLKLLRQFPELVFRTYVLPIFRPQCTLKPSSEDRLLVLGGIWSVPALIDYLVTLKTRGVQITQVIYDLIPIRKPQFFTQGLVDKFTAWLDKTPDYVLSYITISEYVRHDLLNYLNERSVVLPVAAIPLAHELRVHATEERAPTPAVLAHQPYALCVGTIEVRKNHLALCQAWDALLQRHSSEVPVLAIAGRWGWKCDELKAYLTSTNFLNGKVVIVESASDQILHRLYSNALFCVFPSKAEGWGLPIGEAAWCGSPTVFSRSTSLVEILPAGVADMFDPDDQDDMLRVLERYILDPRTREDARGRLRSLKLRSWSDVGDDYVRYLESSTAVAPRSNFVTA